MGPRALLPPASLRLRWLLACGLLGPVLDAGRPGGCRGGGGTVFREQAHSGLGAPEWPVVRAARWVDGAQAPGDPDSADPEPAAGCPVAVRSPLPGLRLALAGGVAVTGPGLGIGTLASVLSEFEI